ncbi:type I-E CRISPR-associated protein Cse2/CasB [Parenemella sanctibonifatiensis]|uniref:Type I-E CRISPR-associated protein Cse2/CasB n=2 Tax=Parenemella sanctibonifatiensis TaxID=2016505 RepID=A0A255EJE6_9ACTN|nr:type I-E CRISPR-associated protein Cse2/CasB [Parenemella sanctibonifatiensis]
MVDDKGQLTVEGGGGALAALRRNHGTEPGDDFTTLRWYRHLRPDGRISNQLRAEHACLIAFGRHQQGQPFAVHQSGRPFGSALREVRRSGKFSEDALDSRVSQFATAGQMTELAHHLTSLVELMGATKRPITFDYTALFWDLVNIQNELRAGAVRRRWGAAYFQTNKNEEE